MIDSILANDFDSWELLLVDDGSEEDTLNALYDYSKRDDRISVIRRETLPKGPLTCRNIGFEKAVGEYVMFLDSDDFVMPSCLRNRTEALKNHPEFDFMVFPSRECRNGKIDFNSVTYAYGYPIHKDDVSAFAKRILPFVVWNNIYRADSLRRHGIVWDVELKSLEDADYNMQTILAGMKYGYADTEPDYAYRIFDSIQSLSNYISTHQESSLHALDKFYSSIQSHYGGKYDRQLFKGLMSVYTMNCRDRKDTDFIAGLDGILGRYDRCSQKKFRIRMQLLEWLSHFLPYRISRQVATGCDLFQYVYELKYRKPHKIIRILRRRHHLSNV